METKALRMRVWKGFLLAILVGLGLTLGETSKTGALEGALGDYGDAPDHLLSGYAHANPKLYADFPSLIKQESTPQQPDYVLHRFPEERVYLGEEVTVERNALTVDSDLDDGWRPGSLPVCSPISLQLFVTVPSTADEDDIFLNVLFDWDHNGVWADAIPCSAAGGNSSEAVEWAIRNLALHREPYNLKPGFQGLIELPEVMTGPVAGELWVRFTISSEPVDERAYVPAEFGGHGWDGSGEFHYGETEDYFTCLLTDEKRPLPGCPLLLSAQPPTPQETNAPPVALSDEISTGEDTPVTVAVLSNDYDPEGNGLIAQLVSGPAHGSLTLNTDGSFTYTPDADFHGTDGFQYEACDPSGACAEASVAIIVDDVNDPPLAEANGPYTCEENQTVTVSSAGSDDPDGNIVQYEWDLDGDGSFETQGANPTFSCVSVGSVTLRLRVTDDDGGTATDSTTVTIEAAADPLCDDDPDRDTDLQIEWDEPLVSGDTATVTLTVTNTANDDYALNLVVRIEVLEGVRSSAPVLHFPSTGAWATSRRAQAPL